MLGKSFVYPFGRTAFDELKRLGDGECGRKRKQQVRMIFDAANLESPHFVLVGDSTHERPKLLSELGSDKRATFFRAKHTMKIGAHIGHRPIQPRPESLHNPESLLFKSFSFAGLRIFAPQRVSGNRSAVPSGLISPFRVPALKCRAIVSCPFRDRKRGPFRAGKPFSKKHCFVRMSVPSGLNSYSRGPGVETLNYFVVPRGQKRRGFVPAGPKKLRFKLHIHLGPAVHYC
jgi:hypothetical protein